MVPTSILAWPPAFSCRVVIRCSLAGLRLHFSQEVLPIICAYGDGTGSEEMEMLKKRGMFACCVSLSRGMYGIV